MSSAANASSSSGSAASAAIEALQPIEVAPKRTPTSKQDTCTWYKKGRCSLPVSCEVCINVEHSDQSCGLGPGGACVDMSAYPSSYAIDLSIMYFPSANFTYCTASDKTCSSCKSSWMQVYKDTGEYPTGKLCQGEQGCICLSQCESPSFSGKVITSQCSLFGGTVIISPPIKHLYTAVSIVGVLVIGITIFRAWRREKRDQALAQERLEHREELRRERNAQRGINGSKLSLTGWKSLQEKLLESERKYLDGGKKPLDQPRHATGAVATIKVESSTRSDDFDFPSDIDGEYEYELEEGLERGEDEEEEEEERSRPNHQLRSQSA